jgi:hypothetical protein
MATATTWPRGRRDFMLEAHPRASAPEDRFVLEHDEPMATQAPSSAATISENVPT